MPKSIEDEAAISPFCSKLFRLSLEVTWASRLVSAPWYRLASGIIYWAEFYCYWMRVASDTISSLWSFFIVRSFVLFYYAWSLEGLTSLPSESNCFKTCWRGNGFVSPFSCVVVLFPLPSIVTVPDLFVWLSGLEVPSPTLSPELDWK